MRILFVSTWFPFPVNNGSKLRVYNLLKQLSRNHEVCLLSFTDPTARPADARAHLGFCKDVEAVGWSRYDPQDPGSVLALLSPTPRSFSATFSPQMRRRFNERIASGAYDAVIASQVNAAVHTDDFAGLPAIFEEVELGVLWENFYAARRLAGRARHGLTWLKHRRFVARQLSRFSACTVVSEPERTLLDSAVPDAPPIVVVPNGIDTAAHDLSREVRPHSLVYAGSLSYRPNLDAVQWFLGEIFPELRRHLPDLHLTVTGDPVDHDLERDGVEQTGLVDDVRPIVAAASATIVPLRSGGGTRVKVLESMALGTPVVATSKGVEGLAVVDGEHVLIADDASSFGAATRRLLTDPKLRTRLSENARRLARDHYDWNRIMPRYEELLESITRLPAAP